MIKIIDYGLGNILAFQNMYKRLNIDVEVARDAAALQGAEKLILPGVGAFDHAMALLQASGMRPVLDELVLDRHIPVLGVCVGMQILANGSDEGSLPGLGWIDGRVKDFRALALSGLRVPHMGWNDAKPAGEQRLFANLGDDASFYFLHSYYFHCERQDDVAAVSGYGVDFTSAVCRGNVLGVQFHLEKSHHFGARLLRNFAEL